MSAYTECRQGFGDGLIIIFLVGTTGTDVHLLFTILNSGIFVFFPPTQYCGLTREISQWESGSSVC